MSLAVVIPFYKTAFLAETLRSVQAQTCQDFRLYLAADGVPVPENIRELLEGDSWGQRPVVAEFPDNRGGTHPARHWNRSVALTSEEWVWLFADDDLMAPDCVEAFTGCLTAARESGCSVLRFQTTVIDEQGAVVRDSPPNPPTEAWNELAVARFVSRREFYVQNHVFERAAWERAGGFADLPTGFFSDEMTFARFARPGRLMTIPGGRVYWRQSRLNLNSADPRTADLKWQAFFMYLRFIEKEVFPDDRANRRRSASMVTQWFLKAAHRLGAPPSPGNFLRFLPRLVRACPAESPRLLPAALKLFFRRTW